MSDTGGNNSNTNDPMMKNGNSPQNSFGNSQNPESSNNYTNRPNDMNSYDSNYGGYNSASRLGGYGSSYGSGYGSGYGSSYGSGYGSSYGSGYGSSYGSGYGLGYGSSYGSGYGSGYSSYGPNQYSNTYSKPLQPGQQGQQGQQDVPPPTFRHDMWGFLNGFHAILNVLYAGTGIVHFGKMFMKMSIKIIKAVFGKSAGLVYKLTGFQFLKNIMQKFAGNGKGDWFGEFNVTESPLENVWANGPEPASTNKTFFGKFMLVLRILSLMGGIVAFFLRRKVANNQHPPVQIEFLDPEIPQVHLKSEDIGLEGVKSFYDEVKLIEQDHSDDLQDATSLKEVVQEVNGEIISQEKEENSVEMKNEEELKQDAVEIQEELKQDESNHMAIISSIENEEVVSLVPQVPVQVSENQDLTQNAPETQVQAQVSSKTKEQIVSEDFWKNEEVFKKIESIQKESEAKQETFELPSVLKTLRSSSSTATKPWLMKKKKNPEPVAAPETSVQTIPESTIQTLPSENLTPEMPVVVETQKEISEVVEVPSTIENPIEGTA